MNLRKVLIAAALLACASCARPAIPYGKMVQIDSTVLLDKIKGGWFAQTIGCTFGGPTEFWYRKCTIPDSTVIEWNDTIIAGVFRNTPGLYDDVYMDLTFMQTMLECGKDAPASEYADRFAKAPYWLWHANQTARYNVLNGINPPESGYWKNNPHADDIDFQIESDFVGMLYPGRPCDASVLADRIGHIMNYGDGWYGGVFIAAMYSYAYVCNDIPTIVSEAVKMIPEGTKFRSCIDDAIRFHAEYPDDWKQCWQKIEELHGEDIGCPDGVDADFNIDARINAAYVVMGLLYGEDDFEKTIEIATRCGQDSDCNPASAAGIWGVVHGYDAIPEKYMKAAEVIADEPFPYTNLSLNVVSEKTLELMGLSDGKLKVKVQKPSAVKYEQSFEGLEPTSLVTVDTTFSDRYDFEFDGNSVVINGYVFGGSDDDVVLVNAYLDDNLEQQVSMPVSYLIRKDEIFFKYGFESGHHKISLRVASPEAGVNVHVRRYITYDNE